jgi:hypothetical protein
MLWIVVSFAFTVTVLAIAGYALIRPFTHLGYRHPAGRLWNPLD